jgi:OOP family OmpA-OmpF porin
MKKLSVLFTFLFLCSVSEVLLAQAYQDSWGFGFGLTYPRFLSTEVTPMNYNLGGFLSLQRNFSENVALRVLGNYDNIEGRIPAGTYTYGVEPPSTNTNMHTSIISGNLDLLYYLVPCLSVDPYFGAGFGLSYFRPVWPKSFQYIKFKWAGQLNAVFGSEWKLCDNWNLNTELEIQSNDDGIDGITIPKQAGFLGANLDGYVNFNAGLVYYFDRGAKCKICDLYNGITVEAPKENYPTLEQIDSLIIAHIPKEVVKEVVVEKPVEKSVEKPVKSKIPETKKWVLAGVNFKTNSAELLPESYPVLEQAVQTLKDNPEVKVEIQGYTDNVGNPKANKTLSLERANGVKNYLVKEGIEGSRLTAVGFGSKNPVAKNTTEIGRAQNRRIEFKVIK